MARQFVQIPVLLPVVVDITTLFLDVVVAVLVIRAIEVAFRKLDGLHLDTAKLRVKLLHHDAHAAILLMVLTFACVALPYADGEVCHFCRLLVLSPQVAWLEALQTLALASGRLVAVAILAISKHLNLLI